MGQRCNSRVVYGCLKLRVIHALNFGILLSGRDC